MLQGTSLSTFEILDVARGQNWAFCSLIIVKPLSKFYFNLFLETNLVYFLITNLRQNFVPKRNALGFRAQSVNFSKSVCMSFYTCLLTFGFVFSFLPSLTFHFCLVFYHCKLLLDLGYFLMYFRNH